MKILHTGDWHIGQSLNGYDRTEEFRDFFRQLEEIATAEKPDVMVVAGDIYDTGVPSVSAQNLYTESLLHLHAVAPDMQVVITAGNHDSGSRLEISRELWGAFGIYILGAPSVGVGKQAGSPALPMERHIIEIKDRDGVLKGYVAAVPYIHKLNFPDTAMDSESGTPREERPQKFFQALLDKVAERNTAGLPVVMTAHTAVTGGDFSCHEGNGVVIGGEECFPLSVFGTGYDYLALGHIHKAQEIPGSGGRARYAGSVIPVNFDETRQHSVTIVEITAHGQMPQVREIVLRTLVSVLTVPKEPVEFEEALTCAHELPADEPAYVRLNVKAKDYLPGNAMMRFLEALEGKKAKGCYIKLQHETVQDASQVQPKIFTAELKQKSPVEMAKLFYRQEFGSELEPELETLLKEVCDEV